MPTSEEKLASFLERNQKYAETYPEPPPLSRGIERNKRLGLKSTVIISCADPRIHPEKYLALNFSEAAIIRNAGGRTQGVMRSLLSLDAIGGVGTVVVVHHTDCGMTQTDEKGFHHRVEAKHPAIEAGRKNNDYGAISDPYKTITEDVNFLKSFPSIVENMDVYGLVLDTFTGVLKRVE